MRPSWLAGLFGGAWDALTDCGLALLTAGALALAIVLALALLATGCETADHEALKPQAPPPGQVCIGVSYFDSLTYRREQRDKLETSLRECSVERDALRYGDSNGWRRVRQTKADAERFQGEGYAVEVDGARCWPDGAEWMWCEPNRPRDERQVLP